MGDWADRPSLPGWSRRLWPKQQQRNAWPFLSSQQVELFKEVFDIFDGDGKGFFTSEELMEVMVMMGGTPTPLEVEGVMYEMDANNDRMVDFTEFLTKFYNCMSEQQILTVFNQLAIQQETETGNKVLTMSVLEKCFAYVGDTLTDGDKRFLEVMFQGADKDGNGTLDINEFLTYIEKLEDDMAGPGDGQRLSDTLLMQQEMRTSNSLQKRNTPVRNPSLLGKVTEWGLMGSRNMTSLEGRNSGQPQRLPWQNQDSLTRDGAPRSSQSTKPLLSASFSTHTSQSPPGVTSLQGVESGSGRLHRLKNTTVGGAPLSTSSRLNLDHASSTQPLLQVGAPYGGTVHVGAPPSPSRAALR